jgi:hypothetical protein
MANPYADIVPGGASFAGPRHHRRVSKTRRLEHRHPLDARVRNRVGNAALVWIQPDRPEVGRGACGQTNIGLNPRRECVRTVYRGHCAQIITGVDDYAGCRFRKYAYPDSRY